MRTLVICISVFTVYLSEAIYAAVGDSSQAEVLSSPVKTKWEEFVRGVEKKPTYARNDCFLYLMSGSYRRGIRELVATKTSQSEAEYICLQGAKVFLDQRNQDFDLRQVKKFYDRFCPGQVEAAKLFTAKALGVGYADYPRRDTGEGRRWNQSGKRVHRWLNKMIDEKMFSPEAWFGLVTSHWDPVTKEHEGGFGSTTYFVGTPAAVLALAEAVEGDFTRVGWTRADVKRVAERLLEHDVRLNQAISWLELSESEIASLEERLSAAQWLEDQSHRKMISESTPEQLSLIIASATRRFGRVQDLEHVLRDLLLDTSIPYPNFKAVHDAARTSLKARDPEIHFRMIPPILEGLSEPQLDRAEMFFGRAEIRPMAVWREAREVAKAIEMQLLGAPTYNMREFIEAFDARKLFEVPKGRELDGIETARLRAVAEVYFRVLRQRLPDFLSLHPRAVDVRWLLETPLQFPLSLHNDRPWRRGWMPFWKRWITPKNKALDGEFTTALDIFKLFENAIKAYMPRVSTAREWNEIVTFRVRGASEYEGFQRWVMNRYAEVAIRVGDGALNWLDESIEANAQTLKMNHPVDNLRSFYLLDLLRQAVPAEQRSDETLMPAAVDILLGTGLQSLASKALFDQLNNPARRMVLAMINDGESQGLESVPPETQKAWLEGMQEHLLGYLEARLTAGATLHVDAASARELAQIARARGFAVSEKSAGPSARRVSIQHRSRSNK